MRDKILVVDDDPAARKLLTLLFQATGEVLAASTGAEALRIIETERPRLMLLDVTMPGMNGLEVLKAARTDATDMTVIMVTGQNDIELAQQALAEPVVAGELPVVLRVRGFGHFAQELAVHPHPGLVVDPA